MLSLLLATALGAEPWQWSGRVGAQVDEGARGLFEIGFRKRELSIQLFTNALDLRWEPSRERGRGWVALRAEPLLAGLFFARWTDGAPDPDRSWWATALVTEAGWVTYLPEGFYAGAQVAGQVWIFQDGPTSTVPAPGPTPVLRADALFGWWHPWAHLWLRAGVDGLATGASPHVHASASTALPWIVRPLLVARAGWAEHTEEVNRVRVGGLNPYEVQLAGAVWSELWVEDYAALRLGPEVGRVDPKVTWSAYAVADLVWADGRGDLGVAAGTRLDFKGRFVEVSAGWSPTRPREGFPAISAFVRLGQDWVAVKRRTKTRRDRADGGGIE